MQPQPMSRILSNGSPMKQPAGRPGSGPGPGPGPPPPSSANFPPPYRSPPNPAVQKMAPQGAYSKFNLSEPNIMNNTLTGSPGITYRHTINNENSQQMQHGLRHMLGQHQQQHQQLQNLQKKLPLPGDTYVSPDNLRDAAHKMFSRNQHERSSLGGMNHINGNTYSNLNGNNRLMMTEDTKRQSFANNSFRQATNQHQDIAKTPPQVPPKPGISKSTSRERLKEAQEDVDNIDQELKHILTTGHVNPSSRNLSTTNGTPPLPALSPELSPDSSPSQNNPPQQFQHHHGGSGIGKKNTDSLTRRSNAAQLKVGMRKYQDEMTSQITQSTIGGLTADLESVLGLQTDITSEEDLDMGDAVAIRKQLDGLENMYAEVLKLLGLRKYGRAPATHSGLDGKRRTKMYGSMSSLPSVSSIGSRSHFYKDRTGAGSKAGNKRPGSAGAARDKSINKRFQRLESHVVTLARSVAHLTSEIKNQHLLIQEVETLRMEIQQLVASGGKGGTLPRGFQGGYMDPENFFAAANNPPRVNNVQANRVRKLTKFFGDEPPLLRLFLKNLGYEKYASAFEEAKIGLLELPYLSDDKLDKLGIPVGPRMRILQEAKVGIANEPNYNVYIL